MLVALPSQAEDLHPHALVSALAIRCSRSELWPSNVNWFHSGGCILVTMAARIPSLRISMCLFTCKEFLAASFERRFDNLVRLFITIKNTTHFGTSSPRCLYHIIEGICLGRRSTCMAFVGEKYVHINRWRTLAAKDWEKGMFRQSPPSLP
ncbi:hypothetical protein B0H17DRAFT_1144764 [Mycena rosella]|uniref:Uncharacterized protein n=1 Tax=Mycena rosella TaxID=1033263 RepID=A0AAD7CS21_MYCRO|nr:hypothetical protein B0H17DRAFT_1144764 [Mycena rosella]